MNVPPAGEVNVSRAGEVRFNTSGEVRQLNARLRGDVYQVLKFLSARRDISVGKLAEQVLTEFAARYLAEAQAEARLAVGAAQRAADALEGIALEIDQ